MPRDLADVLHYFLPELDPDETPALGDVQSPVPEQAVGDAPATAAAAPEPVRVPIELGPREPIASVEAIATRPRSHDTSRLPLPILGLPIGARDVVRAAIAWNLAIETARLGGTSLMLAPASDLGSPLWPEPGVGPLGAELVITGARDLDALYEAASDLSIRRAEKARHGGIVFVRIPPEWIQPETPPATPIDWLLLLCSSDRRDLAEAYERAQAVLQTNPRADIGLTVHGVDAIDEARHAFEHLSRRSEAELGQTLTSYGLLVDDLDVYRAIAAQRPIGLAHPQAPATRALMDVARLLYEDARSRVLG